MLRVKAKTCAISVTEYSAGERGSMEIPWRPRQHMEKEAMERRTEVPQLRVLHRAPDKRICVSDSRWHHMEQKVYQVNAENHNLIQKINNLISNISYLFLATLLSVANFYAETDN